MESEARKMYLNRYDTYKTYQASYAKYKSCLCGRPYFYLESLKKCPICGRKLMFYGDLIEEWILECYNCYPFAQYNFGEMPIVEKVAYLSGRGVKKKELPKIAERILYKEEEKKYFKDIMAFLKIFRKELDKRYHIIKEKEKNGKLLRKNPFERLIIERINYNHCWDAYYRFFDKFPVKSIPKEQILERLKSLSYPEYKKEIIVYSLDHTIEEIGRKFNFTRERINQIIGIAFLELFRDTVEYKTYKKKEEEFREANERYAEALDQYYKSTEERAKQINQAIEKST